MLRGKAQHGSLAIVPEGIQGKPGGIAYRVIGAGAAPSERVILAHRNCPTAIAAGRRVFAGVYYNLEQPITVAVQSETQPIGNKQLALVPRQRFQIRIDPIAAGQIGKEEVLAKVL